MLENKLEYNIEHNSSTDGARLSVSPHRAELFLERLANLDSTDEKKARTFAERFSDLLPTHAHPARPTGNNFMSLARAVGFPPGYLLDKVQPLLQSIWKEPVPLVKEASLMMLVGTYMKACTPSDWDAASGWMPARETWGLFQSPDRFLMVLLYASKHIHLLRYCANPQCKEPYFVARRGSQIYCSSPCAAPAQKEAKLKWWNDHGDARRKKSRKKRGKHAKAT